MHAQPAEDEVGLRLFGRESLAIAVKDMNSAPHAITVRAYSINLSSGSVSIVTFALAP